MIDADGDLRFARGRLVSHHRERVELHEDPALREAGLPLAVYALRALHRQNLGLEARDVLGTEQRAPAYRRRRVNRERRVDVLDFAGVDQRAEPPEGEADGRQGDRDAAPLA